MKNEITEADRLESNTVYRVYRNGVQVDRIRLVSVDPENNVGYVAVGEFDALEEIDLQEWLNHYAMVPEVSRISKPPA